jgi:DNA-directed RNA polymerase sigma subunit (sigma70/sigma32)
MKKEVLLILIQHAHYFNMKTARHTTNAIIVRDFIPEEYLSYTDVAPEEMAYLPFEDVDYEMNCKRLVEIFLDMLPPRERILICMRFELEGYEEHSLQKCGELLLNHKTHRIGITREAVRVLEGLALRRIRNAIIHHTHKEQLICGHKNFKF